MTNQQVHSSERFILLMVMLLTVAAIFLVPKRGGIIASQEENPHPATTPGSSAPGPSPQQGDAPAIQVSQKMMHNMRKEMLEDNFKQMKKDSAELAALAQELQQELGKSNYRILSLGVVDKAEKIEKLARKIKSTAKGF
jgi:hypothetical protein